MEMDDKEFAAKILLAAIDTAIINGIKPEVMKYYIYLATDNETSMNRLLHGIAIVNELTVKRIKEDIKCHN